MFSTHRRTDEELMLAWARGDDHAFVEIFRRYAPLLSRVFSRRLRQLSDAQDLTQQTFLQLHRSRVGFTAGLRLRPWIMTVAMNLCRDLVRRRGRRPETPIGDTVAELTVDSGAAAPGDPDVPRRVRAAVATLPEEQRAVIELHWFEHVPLIEIADRLGASAGAVRTRAHRGYQTLRKKLAREGLDDRRGTERSQRVGAQRL